MHQNVAIIGPNRKQYLGEPSDATVANMTTKMSLKVKQIITKYYIANLTHTNVNEH